MIANNDVLISIIVPVYNCENTLNKCLASIQKQKYQKIEVIVINDGSNDKTEIICQSFSITDDRFIYIYQDNSGVSSARNKGIKEAKGELICFVDADDYISENFFIDMITNQKYDLYICGYSQDFYNKNGFINKSYLKKCNDADIVSMNNADSIFSDLYSKAFFNNPWAKLYRRDIIINNRITFNGAISYGEDCLFNMEYLKYVQSIKVISNVNYYYCCFYTESLTTKYKEGKFDISDVIFEKINYIADYYQIYKNRYLFSKIYLKSFYIMIEQMITNKIDFRKINYEIKKWVQKENMCKVLNQRFKKDIEFNLYLLITNSKNSLIIYGFAYIRKLVKKCITRRG